MELSKEISNWDHIYICLGRRIKIWELLYVRKKDREEHYKIEHDYILNVLKKGKKLGGILHPGTFSMLGLSLIHI